MLTNLFVQIEGEDLNIFRNQIQKKNIMHFIRLQDLYIKIIKEDHIKIQTSMMMMTQRFSMKECVVYHYRSPLKSKIIILVKMATHLGIKIMMQMILIMKKCDTHIIRLHRPMYIPIKTLRSSSKTSNNPLHPNSSLVHPKCLFIKFYQVSHQLAPSVAHPKRTQSPNINHPKSTQSN